MRFGSRISVSHDKKNPGSHTGFLYRNILLYALPFLKPFLRTFLKYQTGKVFFSILRLTRISDEMFVQKHQKFIIPA